MDIAEKVRWNGKRLKRSMSGLFHLIRYMPLEGDTPESRDHDLTVYDHTDDTGNTILNVLSNHRTTYATELKCNVNFIPKVYHGLKCAHYNPNGYAEYSWINYAYLFNNNNYYSH